MKSFTFFWADGKKSYESFESEEELNEYLSSIEDETDVSLIRYENENGLEAWE